jgi:hypothetical protein
MNLFDIAYSKTNFNLDWDNIKPIAEESVSIDKQHHLEEQGVTSFENTDIPTEDLTELDSYYNFVMPEVSSFVFDTLGYSREYKLVKQNAWFSKYLDKGFVRQHSHEESVAVACLYIELPSNAGNIEFKHPYYNHRKDYIVSDDSWLWKEVKVKQNDVIIFDSAIWHRSQPNLSGKQRWTLTTNFGLKTKEKLF